ncbi:hypothetical protein [uncultured virus]|uniref:Uncharacterized protein n=1 Tax=uncultured virus TaxID=340016 RepID=A0A218MLL3_9VIRU|nr:hypothetical protein [uncultured virus]
MPYKQPKNTPLHNDGASAVGAILGATKGIVMGIKALKVAKAAKVAATAAKAAKAGKAAATAAKAVKAAKAAKLAAKSAKLAKAGKTAKAARVMGRSTKVASKATQAGQKAASKAVEAGKKMESKLMRQVDRQMGKSLKPFEKSVKAGEKAASKTAKAGERAANKTAKQASRMAEGKAPTLKEGVKDVYYQAKNKISQGVEKFSDATGKDYGEVMDNLKSKAVQTGINQASNIVEKQKAKNQSSITAEDFAQPLGETEESAPQPYPKQDQPSSYSNPSGASMKSNMPKGYQSSSADNFKTPKTDYQRFFQNLANNSVNANIGGVKVNVGHVGLIAGHLVGKGVDAVKAKKRLNSLKKEKIANNESAARAEEEKKNKNIMQQLDDENKMENLKG